jgi:hypothetical protein
MQDNLALEIESLVQDMQQNMHTCIPGKIKSFDAAKCLAVVTPIGQFKTPAGKMLDYPDVHDVPVQILQYAGQKITMAFPIKAGDGCLLCFAEQQLDQFRDGEAAKCDLRFDLTNAIAIIGVCAGANALVKEACDNDAVIIDNNGSSRVTIKKDEQECKVGDARFVLGEGKMLVDCDLEITGKVTAQQTIDAQGEITAKGSHTVSGHTHPFTDVTPGGAVPSMTQTPQG